MLILISLFLLFVITTLLALFRGFLHSVRDTFRSVFGGKSRGSNDDPEVRFTGNDDGGKKSKKRKAFKSEGEYVDYEDV